MLINIGDIADGALVNAIALMGRRISAALAGPHGRRLEDLDVARWFATYRLTGEVPDLPDLAPALADRLAAIVNGDEIQAALQELLAARLTDAPEADAAQARGVVRLTLSTAGPEADRVAESLADYYDDQISDLVARLGVYEPQVLAQIRSDAFSTRVIAILNAIERHTAALSTRPNQRTEASFVSRYRRHVIEQHGKIEPPDFDRRRRVPIGDIYVPTLITEGLTPDWRLPGQSSLDVYDLAKRLDRSVLLGDPGGGKTTAANVLMHHFASDTAGIIPFLVTLRDYAAKDPPERSVAGYIEHNLATFYQCPPPPGLVDLLLLTGRAAVIFDGLDELLDTSRRGDVTARVERFCAEYPLAPVLVTSRVVGYDQARLDDSQFTCYGLGRLADEQVSEFAYKWFAQDREIGPGEAGTWTEAFIAESAPAGDLRTNPLMLSLLCILYRGVGSLPRNRAEVYEQCAMLMFRRWDARRRIYQDLRVGGQLEPALRHLAWWLLTREDARSAVTERELVNATTEFLQSRGFESQDAATAAAREFVEFCRGRMWVFSDTGTTASGERLYSFTHRTFLEYFAAAQLAYDSDTPEQLGQAIQARITRDEWWVVAELAMQIKDRTSNGGARRIYAALLGDPPRPSDERAKLLRFLALGLRSVDPSPRQVRELTNRIFEGACEATRAAADLKSGVSDPDEMRMIPLLELPWEHALGDLLISSGSHPDIVAQGIDDAVGDRVSSGDENRIVDGFRLAASLTDTLPFHMRHRGNPEWDFWISRVDHYISRHAEAFVTAASADSYLRLVALKAGLMTTGQALDMPGGPVVLFRVSRGCFETCSPYFIDVYLALRAGWPAFGQPRIAGDLNAFGEYLIEHPQPPWLQGRASEGLTVDWGRKPPAGISRPGPLSRAAYLGAAAILAILEETGLPPHIGTRLGPLRHIAPYLARRRGFGHLSELPSLLVPDEFKQTFRDWAEGQVSFMAPEPGS
jgi:hypothetical protein